MKRTLIALALLLSSCAHWHKEVKPTYFWAPTLLVVAAAVFGVAHILVENLDKQEKR